MRVEGLVHESKEKAANFYYIEGKRLLALAEKGDKDAARDAYDQFDRISQYFRSYKDENQLMRKAHDLGIVYVFFNIENNSNAILPRNFEKEIKRINVSDLESKWRTVHLSPKNNQSYDYKVVMNLRQIDVSPEQVREREYQDKKTIEYGWRYVLDSNGNVLKDSLGNDVKEPNEIEIQAVVFEVLQTKSAIVSGELEFFDTRTGRIFHQEPITAETLFENYAATYDGDKRALSKASKKMIGNSPTPFPSNEVLVLQTADRLKPIIADKLRSGLIN